VPIADVQTPPRLLRAQEAMHRLADEGIHFAPIRHHSPACAIAVEAQMAELRPTAVLIEGPEEFGLLLDDLQNERTRPPVAILSHSEGEHGRSTGFFPLADYSPEWVALRGARRTGASVAFIDLAWGSRERREPADDEEALLLSIQGERHLAHSRTLAELARREHCRDHDELWDQLFELRSPAGLRDWRALGADVFVWSSLARLDYEPEVLMAEGSIAREGMMASRIRSCRAEVEGPILVVTGAFHTLALVEALGGAPEGADVRAAAPAASADRAVDAPSAWLIRYDFRRLDALDGYGAGMPSPGFHQRSWQHLTSPGQRAVGDVATSVLVDIARDVSAAGTRELLGVADVTAAALQAQRLADLRGHSRAGRTDVLDAITSCFVADDGPSAALREAVARVFAGDLLGDVPEGVAAPPVVAEARRRAAALRFSIDDSARRHVSLDVRRSSAHRARSRFLALMEFLGTGFAQRISGPDFVAGVSLGRLHEEWSYAWSPLVEAELIDRSAEGATLIDIAEQRLRRVEEALDASADRRSSSAVSVLAQAVVIGIDDAQGRLASLVDRHIDDDPSLASVVAAAHRLLALWQARDQLDLADAVSIRRLIERCIPAAGYLIPALAVTPVHSDDAAIDTLVSLRDLVRQLADSGIRSTDGEPIETAAVHRELARLRLGADTTSAVAGALTAFAAVDGELLENGLEEIVVAQLGSGADAERAVRFLAGFMKAAPDLLLHTPELFAVVDAGLRRLGGDAFLAYLPELRRAFSWLKPRETAALADRIAADNGVSSADLVVRHIEVTATALGEAIELERLLAASLIDDGLGDWAAS